MLTANVSPALRDLKKRSITKAFLAGKYQASICNPCNGFFTVANRSLFLVNAAVSSSRLLDSSCACQLIGKHLTLPSTLSTRSQMVSLLVSMIPVRGGLLEERNWFAHRVEGTSSKR
jgi:hypothetical protein